MVELAVGDGAPLAPGDGGAGHRPAVAVDHVVGDVPADPGTGVHLALEGEQELRPRQALRLARVGRPVTLIHRPDGGRATTSADTVQAFTAVIGRPAKADAGRGR